MISISQIKLLFKDYKYQNLLELIEKDPKINFDKNFSLELSIIFYYYIRSNLELGFLGKALKLAKIRYNTKNKSRKLQARLYDIITYSYALMNKGFYQLMPDLEQEGNELCNVLLQDEEINNEILDLVSLFKNCIGNSFLLTIKLDKALLYYNESLEIREKLGNETLIADSLLNIGITNYDHGNYSQAIDHETRALNLYKKWNEKFGILNASVNLVILKLSQGDWKEAMKLINEIMPVAERFHNLKFHSILLQMQGDINENKGNLDEAIKCYNDSLKIKQQLGNMKMVADGLTSIGHVHIEKKEYQEALECFNESIEYYTNSSSDLHIIISLFWIFWIYYTIGNGDKMNVYASRIEQKLERYHDVRSKQIHIISKSLQESYNNNMILTNKDSIIIQNLLEENNVVEVKLKIIALNMLCIYKLNKLKSSDNDYLRKEISEIIDNIYKLGEEKNSYKFIVMSFNLKAKFNLILGDIEKSIESINSALNLAKKYELERLITETEREQEEVSKKIDLWYKNIPVNPPIAEKIEESNILEYLKDIMNIF